MSSTCSPMRRARRRRASESPYSSALSACCEPSSATRMLLIMARALRWPASNVGPSRAQGLISRARATRLAARRLQTAGRPVTTVTVSRRDEALCEELKELATKLGLRVREEILLREVGYRVRSGVCRVRDENVLFLDRHLLPGERLEVLLGALEGGDIESQYVSPALRSTRERLCEVAQMVRAVAVHA